MRLSYWHKELARKVAQGKRNKDIKKEIEVSDSRLSVLRANPIFQKQVDVYKKQEDEKYNKAIKILGDSAEDIAKELVGLAKGALTPHKVKLDAGMAILDKVGQAEGNTDSGGGEEMIFEQMLRVTKKTMGLDSGPDEGEEDFTSAQKELDEDLVNVTPVEEE